MRCPYISPCIHHFISANVDLLIGSFLLELAVADGELLFSSSNANSELCSSVQSLEDNVVETSSTVSLQIEIGIRNNRISVLPSNVTLNVLDNDSMYVIAISAVALKIQVEAR